MPRTKSTHKPVLINEVLDKLDPSKGETYLDATAGYGGHAAKVIGGTDNESGAVLVDRDAEASAGLKTRFGAARVINADFATASEKLLAEGRKFDMILADLGVSSPHLDIAPRGFSFREDSPLDMRMDPTQELTAEEVVNQWSEEHLVKILAEYGQEPKARKIAKEIVLHRPIVSTKQLAEIAERAWPGHSRRHPATRTFQAIRLAVNDELGQLERALPVWLELLAAGGRMVIISFHSLEDGIVKRFFAEHSKGYEAVLEVLTSKPITASNDELLSNRRSRSAKLRAASKIKTKRKENTV